METKCVGCKQAVREPVYGCCNQTKFYCIRCSSKFCYTCGQTPKRVYTKPKPRQPTPNKYYRSCSLCKEYLAVADYEQLQQPKCGFTFCYKCLLPYYQNYVKTISQITQQGGIRPELPFQLPCHCQIPQNSILSFLQKCCFCCNKKIQNKPSYRLNNDMRVMKDCLSTVTRYSSGTEKQREIRRMVLKCEGCDTPLTEQLPNEPQLNVCRQCYQENQKLVRIIQNRQKQAEKSNQQLSRSRLKSANNQPLQPQPLHNRPADNNNNNKINQPPNKANQEARPSNGKQHSQYNVDQLKPQSIYLQNNYSRKSQRNKDHPDNQNNNQNNNQKNNQNNNQKNRQKSREENAQRSTDENDQKSRQNGQKSRENGQKSRENGNQYSNEKSVYNRQKSRQSKQKQQKDEQDVRFQGRQKIKARSSQFNGIIEEAVETKKISFGYQSFKNLVQCPECFVFMHSTDPLYTLEQSNGNVHLIAQNQQKKMPKQGVRRVENVCKLCVYGLKQVAWLSSLQRNKNQQVFQRIKQHKSVAKTEKKPEKKHQPQYTGIFSTFDYMPPSRTSVAVKLEEAAKYEPRADLGKLNGLKASQIQNTALFPNKQKCIECGQTVSSSQFKKGLRKCRDCQIIEEEEQLKRKNAEKILQIVCRRCQKSKKMKESDLGKMGLCNECAVNSYTFKK